MNNPMMGMNPMQMIQQLKANPIQFLQRAGYNVPNNLNDPKPSESDTAPALPAYSYAAPPEQVETIIDYQGDTDFAAVIDGRRADDVWPVMEELMEVLRRTNKPLYNATIRKIQD